MLLKSLNERDMDMKIYNYIMILGLGWLVCVTGRAQTNWSTKVDTKKMPVSAEILRSVDGGKAEPFMVKGICYSPTPINTNPNFLRGLSDYFWDTIENDPMSSVPSKKTHNYAFLWKKDGTTIKGDPYRADLYNIKNSLGCNAIRAYGMTSRLLPVQQVNGVWQTYVPDEADWDNPDVVAKVTHSEFLDECEKQGLYVIVGLFLSDYFWVKDKNEDASNALIIKWYTKMYQEVVEEMKDHPAVLGFIINNEVDGFAGNSNPTFQAFFWNQIRSISKDVSDRAPNKLVGFAFHNFLDILKQSIDEMKTCPDIDFWGYNVYGVTEMDLHQYMLVNSTTSIGYQEAANENPDIAKPILFTEWGLPVTTHTVFANGNSQPSAEDNSDFDAMASITDGNATVVSGVAGMITAWGGDLYGKKYPIWAGGFYFEFSDELYKQDGKWQDLSPDKSAAGLAKAYYTWFGGNFTGNYPGRYWDEEGFGLYHPKRYEGIADSATSWAVWVWDGGDYNGPDPQYDSLLAGKDVEGVRKPVINALKEIYDNDYNDKSFLRRSKMMAKQIYNLNSRHKKLNKRQDAHYDKVPELD
jgi:hypothetical protein